MITFLNFWWMLSTFKHFQMFKPGNVNGRCAAKQENKSKPSELHQTLLNNLDLKWQKTSKTCKATNWILTKHKHILRCKELVSCWCLERRVTSHATSSLYSKTCFFLRSIKAEFCIYPLKESTYFKHHLFVNLKK